MSGPTCLHGIHLASSCSMCNANERRLDQIGKDMGLLGVLVPSVVRPRPNPSALPNRCGVCAVELEPRDVSRLDACPTCARVSPTHVDCAGQVCAECSRPVEDPRQGVLW